MATMTLSEKSAQGKEAHSATRFQVSSPMRFRIFGERLWRDGWVETMSLAELLFHTEQELEAGKSMDIRIMLPSPHEGPHGGIVVGHAKVLHSVRLPEMPGRVFVTASLSTPRLLPFTARRGRG